MSYPFDRGLGYPESVHVDTLGDLTEEIVRARTKFPRGNDLALALLEEIHELFDELALSKGKTHRLARAEAIQVACVALRIAEEGDRSWCEDPETTDLIVNAVSNGRSARHLLHRKYPTAGGDVKV